MDLKTTLYKAASLKDSPPTIKIVNVVGTNLVSCDLNGKSDPFIRIGFNSKYEHLDKKNGLLFQSEPKYESLEFDHAVDKSWPVQPGSTLQIEIWDKDSLGKSDWMGCILWKVDDLLDKGRQDLGRLEEHQWQGARAQAGRRKGPGVRLQSCMQLKFRKGKVTGEVVVNYTLSFADGLLSEFVKQDQEKAAALEAERLEKERKIEELRKSITELNISAELNDADEKAIRDLLGAEFIKKREEEKASLYSSLIWPIGTDLVINLQFYKQFEALLVRIVKAWRPTADIHQSDGCLNVILFLLSTFSKCKYCHELIMDVLPDDFFDAFMPWIQAIEIKSSDATTDEKKIAQYTTNLERFTDIVKTQKKISTPVKDWISSPAKSFGSYADFKAVEEFMAIDINSINRDEFTKQGKSRDYEGERQKLYEGILTLAIDPRYKAELNRLEDEMEKLKEDQNHYNTLESNPLNPGNRIPRMTKILLSNLNAWGDAHVELLKKIIAYAHHYISPEPKIYPVAYWGGAFTMFKLLGKERDNRQNPPQFAKDVDLIMQDKKAFAIFENVDANRKLPDDLDYIQGFYRPECVGRMKGEWNTAENVPKLTKNAGWPAWRK